LAAFASVGMPSMTRLCTSVIRLRVFTKSSWSS
jgi:hypothetical protein